MNEWLSCHIYYYDVLQMDKLLVAGVAPLVKELRFRNLLNKYFFIRYKDKGPCIRFRVNIDSSNLEQTKRILENRLYEYLKTHPSASSKEVRELYDNPLPNNSLHYIRYEPEFDRYGGSEGIKIAEAHFEDSSDIVFALLARIHDHPSSKSLRFLYATQIVAMLALSAGIKRTNLSAFFDEYIKHQIITSDIKQMRDEEYFLTNKSIFKTQFDKLFQLYENNSVQCEKLVLDWKEKTLKTLSELKKLSLRNHGYYSGFDEKIGLERPVIFILKSYIHMTANRFGIGGIKERFLLSLLKRISEDL